MSDTQLIKDRVDIVELISEYVQLKPAGINHKGLCPFHREKTPSFMVNRDRQNWHCFGCSKGGDIFSFIQEIEGMEFVEALKFLADRAGVPLTNTRSEAETSQKNRVKNINTEAARFFHRFLLDMPISNGAREYLKKRGLKNETIEEWQIGYISDQWDLLTQYLLKKGFGIDDLVASGLTIKKEGGGFYDRFRGRIMFPIWDAHDNVVGFTGRILVETPTSGGKYVNTPQTAVYDKSRVIFGLNRAKQAIKSKDQIIMVEGQMDVIACNEAGQKNVVAASGTALTHEQVKLLNRYSKNIAIAFDADAAGVNAAKRGIDIALSEGMNIKIIRIPEGAGKDPDECLKKNPAIWFDAVGNAEEIMDWYFTKAFRGKNVNDPKQKQIIANELIPEILRIPYAVEQDFWLRELSKRLNVDVAILKEDMHRITRNTKPQTANIEAVSVPVINKSHLDLLVERLIVLSLRCMPIQNGGYFEFDVSQMLSTPSHKALYDILRKSYTDNRLITIQDLRNDLQDGDKESIIETLKMQGDLLFSDIGEKICKREMEIISKEIGKEWRKQRLQELEQEIALAEKQNDGQKLKELYAIFESMK